MNIIPEWVQLVENKTKSPFALLNYNVHVFKNYELTYIETPKNACTSAKRLLSLAFLKTELCSDNIHNEFSRLLTRISKLGPHITQNAIFGSYYRFAVIRNPIDRFISAFEDKIINNDFEKKRIRPKFGFGNQEKIELLDFLYRLENMNNLKRDIHFMTQTRILSFDSIKYDLLIDTIEYEEKMTLLLKKFGIEITENIKNVISKHYNKNEKNYSFNQLTSKEEELIRKIYKKDFENFGYR